MSETKEILKYILKLIVALVCFLPFWIIIFGPPIIGYYLAIPDYFWIAAIASLMWVFPATYILGKISKYIDRAAWYLLDRIHDI